MSIALLASRFDVLWVMGQVGHADSKMTMDVHPQLQQRVKREHGRAFDRLVDQAREQLYGAVPAALNSLSEQSLGPARSSTACRSCERWGRPRPERRHRGIRARVLLRRHL